MSLIPSKLALLASVLLAAPSLLASVASKAVDDTFSGPIPGSQILNYRGDHMIEFWIAAALAFLALFAALLLCNDRLRRRPEAWIFGGGFICLAAGLTYAGFVNDFKAGLATALSSPSCAVAQVDGIVAISYTTTPETGYFLSAKLEGKGKTHEYFMSWKAANRLSVNLIKRGFMSSNPSLRDAGPLSANGPVPAAQRDAECDEANLSLLQDQTECASIDYGKAMDWCVNAYPSSNGDAMNSIGVMYRDGLGVARNPKIAYLLFLSVQMEGLGDESTQNRAGRNLAELEKSLPAEDIAEALGYTGAYVDQFVMSRGTDIENARRPVQWGPRIGASNWPAR